MSYLTLAKGIPDFGKAVISFWFRVPKVSIIKVAEEAAAFTGDRSARPRLLGVLPLIAFGKMFEGYTMEDKSAGNASYTKSFYGFDPKSGYTLIGAVETHTYGIGPLVYEGKTHLENPSYVGVACEKDRETGVITSLLQVRLQTAEFGVGELVQASARNSISNSKDLVFATNPSEGEPAQDTATSGDVCLTSGVVPDGTELNTRSYVDQSAVWSRQKGPDAIVVGHGREPMEIVADTWHHLLLSFDVTQPITATGGTVFDAYPCAGPVTRRASLVNKITSSSKLWIALDDKNYAGEYLGDPRFNPPREELGLGLNDVAPFNSLWTTFVNNGGRSERFWSGGHVTDRNWPVAGMPVYTYQGGKLPTADYEIGIPCVTSSVDRICRIEMAELQIFTDVILNTDSIANRRAFIDKDGKPVDPTQGEIITTTKRFDPRGPGERLLGKKPEILLHGNQNWIDGYNTGTIGVLYTTNPDGSVTLTEKPAGQFKRTAAIEKYKPEPELRKSPPPEPPTA